LRRATKWGRREGSAGFGSPNFSPERSVIWYVYIARCADETLYTGVAKDPVARLHRHNSGRGARYTRSRLPVELVYRECASDRSAALRREHEIKSMRPLEKRRLVAAAGSVVGEGGFTRSKRS
jgi:predicted GIY-YIG superfamily endonuclease